MSAFAGNLLRRHRLTVDEYHRMGDAGILAADAQVELIQGEVIDMAPIGSRHASTVDRLMQRLVLAVGEVAIVRCQNPIVLDENTEPQPDLCLLKPRGDFYSCGHPRPSDVLLVVEVAETTLAYDRDIKLPLYAGAGIPEAWIIDLSASMLHIFRAPSGERYSELTETAAPGAVALAALPEVSLDLAGLFGPLP